MATDRLGSVRGNSNGERMAYWPYGQERPLTGGSTTPDGREKFGTYFRDAAGADYADQRYYTASAGRFYTPDPGGIKTADPKNPTSWNRYLYSGDDPVNSNDPTGALQCWILGFDFAGGGDGKSGCLQDPCDTTFLVNFAPVLNPFCFYAGPIRRPGTDLQGDQCSVSLWERPTPTSSFPGWHTYINWSDLDTGVTFDFEGGPDPAWAAVGGTLTGTIAAPGQGLNSSSKDDATNPALPSNKEVGSPYLEPDACADLAKLRNWVTSYNRGGKVTYSFIPFGNTYNSNSFAFTLDSQLGLVSYFGRPSGWVPGWGKLVPGL